MDANDNYLNPADEPGMIITAEAKGFLIQAGKWATFLGIIGFVFTVFTILGAIVTGINMTNIQRNSMAGMELFLGILFIVMGVAYVIMAVVFFFFSLYLYKFGTTITEGILVNDAAKTNAAFGKLKSFFKFWGVTTIIVLVLYGLMFLFIVFGGPAMAGLTGNYIFKLNSPLVP